jgi:K+-sensing histidine kinase KdpD
MNNFKVRRLIKTGLLLVAILIGIFSLIYTHNLVLQLKLDEEKKMGIWAEAQKRLAEADSEEDRNFYLDIVKGNTTIPVIVENADGTISFHRNLDSSKVDKPGYIDKRLKQMKGQYPPIETRFMDEVNYIYYDDSYLLRQLQQYPIYQIVIVGLFLLVSYVAFSVSKRSEENKVWVGLAKETAHQLGTPISSLMAWIDLIELDSEQATPEAMEEMKKDIKRLNTITHRFSKIGSKPELTIVDLSEEIQRAVDYMKTRTSSKIQYTFVEKHRNLLVKMNPSLFEWVIENLCTNAVDSIGESGDIAIQVFQLKNKAVIDVTDNGKGIAGNLFNAIFRPGFTTKKRGWGLGLSLAKRIINEYHGGQIFVKESLPHQRTTFRIMLKCESAAM